MHSYTNTQTKHGLFHTHTDRFVSSFLAAHSSNRSLSCSTLTPCNAWMASTALNPRCRAVLRSAPLTLAARCHSLEAVPLLGEEVVLSWCGPSSPVGSVVQATFAATAADATLASGEIGAPTLIPLLRCALETSISLRSLVCFVFNSVVTFTWIGRACVDVCLLVCRVLVCVCKCVCMCVCLSIQEPVYVCQYTGGVAHYGEKRNLYRAHPLDLGY